MATTPAASWGGAYVYVSQLEQSQHLLRLLEEIISGWCEESGRRYYGMNQVETSQAGEKIPDSLLLAGPVLG